MRIDKLGFTKPLLLMVVAAVVALGSLLLFGGTTLADITPPPFLIPDGCAQDVYGIPPGDPGLTCTAKEIEANVTGFVGPAECEKGEDVNFPSIDVRFDPKGGVTRYDVGIFISTDGDPNGTVLAPASVR
jgi:hypothetical protein